MRVRARINTHIKPNQSHITGSAEYVQLSSFSDDWYRSQNKARPQVVHVNENALSKKSTLSFRFYHLFIVSRNASFYCLLRIVLFLFFISFHQIFTLSPLALTSMNKMCFFFAGWTAIFGVIFVQVTNVFAQCTSNDLLLFLPAISKIWLFFIHLCEYNVQFPR